MYAYVYEIVRTKYINSAGSIRNTSIIFYALIPITIGYGVFKIYKHKIKQRIVIAVRT